ncbi:tRNA (N(6)-L-threonylcarbamoyladenosine(37)-C(2))-methylthiotransferase MtaB, partial [Cylindrospermopsis raciborskii CS-506_C]|nr:tRNA (N(6)-L-threonylcarbamoyladenosine(37)-C(2))-methylthiotransferase MtaB [Cylindrospermopsis raciborskii CS-506_C]
LAAHLDGMVGHAFRVLSETRSMGRTEHFTPVRLAEPIEPGRIVTLVMTGHDGRQAIAA